MFGVNLLPPKTLMNIIKVGIEKRLKENNITHLLPVNTFGMIYKAEGDIFKFEIPAKSGSYFNYEEADKFCAALKAFAKTKMAKDSTLEGAKVHCIADTVEMEIYYITSTGEKKYDSTYL